MTLGQQIKEAREKKNLSQEELAEMVGVSRQAVSKWENDTAVPHGINRETLAQVLELELESDSEVIIQKQIPLVAWIGWALAAILLVIFAYFAIKLLPIMLTPLSHENIDTKENLIIVDSSAEPEMYGIKSIRFFDSAANEVKPDGGWYNTADIADILISWEGGPADSIQMFVTPTGTETLDQTKLLKTKVITDGESAALLRADALHSKDITTMHLHFEIHIGEKTIGSGMYNVFYEPNAN